MREGGVDAVHVTIAYHEMFRETVANIETWNRMFERFPDLIFHGKWANDVALARRTGRTAIFFGFRIRRPSRTTSAWSRSSMRWARAHAIDLQQPVLAGDGLLRNQDPGLTRMGKQVIRG